MAALALAILVNICRFKLKMKRILPNSFNIHNCNENLMPPHSYLNSSARTQVGSCCTCRCSFCWDTWAFACIILIVQHNDICSRAIHFCIWGLWGLRLDCWHRCSLSALLGLVALRTNSCNGLSCSIPSVPAAVCTLQSHITSVFSEPKQSGARI